MFTLSAKGVTWLITAAGEGGGGGQIDHGYYELLGRSQVSEMGKIRSNQSLTFWHQSFTFKF
jgi:hypothetical protein